MQEKTKSRSKIPVILVLLAIFLTMKVGFAPTAADSHVAASTQHVSDQIHTTPKSQPRTDMRVFFQTHPHPKVRGEFRDLLEKGLIKTSSQDLGSVAAFQLAMNKGKLVPVLFMTSKLFEPQNHELAQLVIYHEYIHFTQWRDGTVPEKVFIYHDIDGSNPEEICKGKWYAEAAAYQEECQFGRQNGLLDHLDQRSALVHICNASKEAFASTLMQRLVTADPSADLCSDTWNAI